MREDEIGRLYPHIDEEKCTKCGLCRRRCPVNAKMTLLPTNKAYAAWSLDPDERRSSTSGGFAAVISRKIIKEGGVVFGSALTTRGIEHIRVDNEEDIKRLKGSKYVESPIVFIYQSLKQDLEKGITVLFVGTPCQVAGVRAYLNREYENLFLIELICAGVPPQKLLWEHLGYIDRKPQEVRFRDNTGSRLIVRDENKIIYQRPVYNDYFFMGFGKKLYLRESCHRCSFIGMNRVADITIGDFWGLNIKEKFDFDIKDGVSLIFPHNRKGEDLIKQCAELLFLEERSVDEAITFNPRYVSSPPKHPKADYFVHNYNRKGFKYALKKSLRKERVRYFIYRNLRAIKHGGK